MTIINEYKDHDRMLIAVDCIIFGFDGENLKALLIKRDFEPGMGNWSLMGGFIKNEESVDEGAARVLQELTGLTDIYMEQLYCFGEVNRDPGGRVISISYFALIKINGSLQLMKEHNPKWFNIQRLPVLVFDHKKMIELAKERIRIRATSRPIGFELLAENFTLPQLQKLYEAIYDTTFDKRNFSRKILSLNILKKLDIKEKTNSKKGAFYYTFDHNKYKKLEHQGLKFI